jgi:hypothetical protein
MMAVELASPPGVARREATSTEMATDPPAEPGAARGRCCRADRRDGFPMRRFSTPYLQDSASFAGLELHIPDS